MVAFGNPVYSRMPEAQMIEAKSRTPRERVSTPHPRQETNEDGIMIIPKRG
jgi:hypothetical protein